MPAVRTLSWIVAVGTLAVATVVTAQEPLPSFDLASVKRSNPDARGSGTVSSPAASSFTARNMSAQALILYAYGLPEYQIASDGPAWTRHERFDIVARYPEGSKPEQRRLMLQRLLAERFQLRTHSEQRRIQGYELRRARPNGSLGPRLLPSSMDCDAYAASGGQRAFGPNETVVCAATIDPDRLRGGSRPLSLLASMLSRTLHSPVADATGLIGSFDFVVEWAPDLTATPGAQIPTGDKPSLFTALQEQLGLKLEGVRTPVQVLVIDRIERPSDN